ncbi:MAG TPA: AAA family ATPase [Phototrophicaceae bacterium]|jgi:dephospho-CoA kinase|nr:AAA family ATPase [Phototrophicaceae bacterium]
MMPLIIERPRSLALVGMPGAGKTLCAKYLEDRGYFQFRFGGIIEDEVVRRGLPVIPDNERIVREEFRANEGMDSIAKRALPHLKTALESHTSIVIDGLYSFSEYKLLRKELGADMVVVAISCPRWLRYERLAARPIRPLTQEQAEERDWQEIEKLEKGGPIAIADFTLVNGGSVEELLASLDALMTTLSFQP